MHKQSVMLETNLTHDQLQDLFTETMNYYMEFGTEEQASQLEDNMEPSLETLLEMQDKLCPGGPIKKKKNVTLSKDKAIEIWKQKLKLTE